MSMLTDVWERLRTLVFRAREEREMDDELRFHLEMEAEQNRRAGLSETEAVRRSRAALGGIERTKEDVRDARGTRLWFDGAGDVRFAIRSLVKAPGFAITAVLTLAVGVGATTAVFSAVDAVLLRPLPFSQPGRLVRVYQNELKAPAERQFVTPVHVLEWRNRLTALQAVGSFINYSESGADVGTGNAAHRIRVLPVDAGYFQALGVDPAIGAAFTRADETGVPKVILSHALWEQQFGGDPAAVGRTLIMNGAARTVVGVMPQGYADPVVGAIDAWVPLDLRPGMNASNADNHYLSVVARLRRGVTISAAQAELDRLSILLGKQYPDAAYTGARLYPLKNDIVGSSTLALEMMLAAVGLVLILVCVNVANLLLVRGSDRAHEFALRSALGAGRSRLVRQMLVESAILAAAGGVGSLIVARLSMRAIVAIGSGSIPRLTALQIDGRLLGFAIAVTAASAIAFGLAPALRAAKADPRDALAEQSRGAAGGRRHARVRHTLVAAQMALALVLLVGAGLLLASVDRIRNVDLGIQPDHALVFGLSLPDARYDSTQRAAFYDGFDRRVETLTGVTAAGGISKLPATGQFNQWGTHVLTGPIAGTKEGWALTEERVVSGHYFRAAGIPLVEGRLFDDHDDATTPHRVVISRGLARRLYPGISAIGQRLHTGGWDCDVIGVVGDVAIDPEGRPDVYVYHAHAQVAGDRNWSLDQIVRVRGAVAAVQPEVRRLLGSLDPQLVMYQPTTLADAIGRGEAQRQFVLTLLMAFAVVSLGLAALGLFGVLSYGVRLRSREFGIRMALGADSGAVRRMVLREGLALTGIGMVVGLGGSVLLARAMASLLFKVRPLDPVVLTGAVVCMLLVATAAAYLPARQATAADPMHALRE